MKLAISNLAWDYCDDKEVAEILKDNNIRGIELALTKIWPDLKTATKTKVKKYRKYWNSSGVKIVAITSLLYGHPELTIFESAKARKNTIEYLKMQAGIAGLLGAKVMMFGSPKNRIKGKLSDTEVNKIACDFFNRISDTASKYDICFAIEPNPAIYGGDFILTTSEAVKFVKRVNHDHFGLNLDSGTIAVNNSDYDRSVEKALPHTCHAHISEPYLKPIPGGKTDHRKFAKALKKYDYGKWISIEMPLSDNINKINQIDQTLNYATKTYN